MEIPNTNPQSLTQTLLEEKISNCEKLLLQTSLFFMGVSNNNLDEVLKTNPKTVGTLKIFMGSSTGDMLVDDKKVLEEIFEKSLCKL